MPVCCVCVKVRLNRIDCCHIAECTYMHIARKIVCARKETRTPTPCGARPWNACVYQFRHSGIALCSDRNTKHLLFAVRAKISLLNLLLQGVFLHIRIVLLQDKTFSGIFLVFCGRISWNRLPFFFCFSAFKCDNDSVFFSFCHGVALIRYEL